MPNQAPFIKSPLMERLEKEKKIAIKFQERRHEDWNDNYELYRNTVKTNRLTQRQAVNIPLMKETIRTLLSRIDDPPNIEWQELNGDEQKEIVIQELWNADFDRDNYEGIDIQDKKTVLINGRAFKKLGWDRDENQVKVWAMDPFDVVIDPMVDPLDIETARFIVHQNIFRSMRQIMADDRYSATAKKKLQTFLNSEEGIVQSGETRKQFESKMDRLKSMDVSETDIPQFAAGDTIVNLTEHITQEWNESRGEFERRLVVYAEDSVELMNESLKNATGMELYPYVMWGDDVETNDVWSDGVADLVRTPNKILNIWFSQAVENRTLRNFQMHWYDSTVKGYSPQTYEPGPGRMLPAPGNPRETIMPVEVDGLEDTLTFIEFLIRTVERGSGATAIEKGVSEKKQITLGEVETLVGKAMERHTSMAKFYRRSWYELAIKWYHLMHTNFTGSRELFKLSAEGKLWPKKVTAKAWKSDTGYRPLVRSTSEQEEERTKGMQRFLFVLQQFPNNPVLRKVAQKRMLELVDLTPEELRQVEQAEEQTQEEAQQQAEQQGEQGGRQDVMGEIERRMQELEQVQNGS